MHDHRPRSCSLDPEEATVNKFKFQLLENEERAIKYLQERQKRKQQKLGDATNSTNTNITEDEEDRHDFASAVM